MTGFEFHTWSTLLLCVAGGMSKENKHLQGHDHVYWRMHVHEMHVLQQGKTGLGVHGNDQMSHGTNKATVQECCY